MRNETRLPWKPIILLSIAIGAVVGLLFGILQTVFDIQFPAAIAGPIAGLLIAAVLMSRNLLTKGEITPTTASGRVLAVTLH